MKLKLKKKTTNKNFSISWTYVYKGKPLSVRQRFHPRLRNWFGLRNKLVGYTVYVSGKKVAEAVKFKEATSRGMKFIDNV